VLLEPSQATERQAALTVLLEHFLLRIRPLAVTVRLELTRLSDLPLASTVLLAQYLMLGQHLAPIALLAPIQALVFLLTHVSLAPLELTPVSRVPPPVQHAFPAQLVLFRLRAQLSLPLRVWGALLRPTRRQLDLAHRLAAPHAHPEPSLKPSVHPFQQPVPFLLQTLARIFAGTRVPSLTMAIVTMVVLAVLALHVYTAVTALIVESDVCFFDECRLF
jgi:hypothetical protein